MPAGPFKNSLLRRLDPQVIDRLSLRPVDLEQKLQLAFPGEPVQQLYFIEAGIASMTTGFRDGSEVEVGLFGYEGVLGASVFLGLNEAMYRVTMQIGGHGFTCPVSIAREEFRRAGAFQNLVLRFIQSQLRQTGQTAGCNARHEVEQRLSRWLLLCSDRVESSTLPLSHEFLAQMLGSSRPTLTLTAGALKREGLIDYERGIIRILDRPGLERRSCECYAILRDYIQHVTEDTAS